MSQMMILHHHERVCVTDTELLSKCFQQQEAVNAWMETCDKPVARRRRFVLRGHRLKGLGTAALEHQLWIQNNPQQMFVW